MLAPNSYVVYASHGVCRVDRIVKKIIGRVAKDFAILRNGAMTLMVPVDNPTGCRPVSDASAVDKAIETATKGRVKVDNTTWNRRYREYMERLKTGEILEYATVYRSLQLLRVNKDLSFGERKMLDLCLERLSEEISHARGVPQDEARELLI